METTKKISFFFLLFSFSIGYSQTFFFEVIFKDKGTAFTINDPSPYLSASSIQKKANRNISIDQLDIPVNVNYINDLLLLGLKVPKKSKWRNSVLAYANDTNVFAQVRLLPFVKSAKYFTSYSGTLKTNTKLHEGEEWYSKPYGKSLNQLEMLNGQFLHERGFRGEGMDIAVFDAGFPHMFAASILLEQRNQIKTTYDFIDNDNTVFEKNQHGAMVLSVLAANDNYMSGAAPYANYHLFITEDENTETLLEEYNRLMAAEMADSVGVDVVNSSLGYTTFDDNTTNHIYADLDGKTTLVAKAANTLFKKGVLVVASAGNSADEAWHYISTPADGDSVLAVGAVDEHKKYAFFSSTGFGGTNDVKPNVAAQGYPAVIYQSVSGYGLQSGTSFSGPIIAGLAACYWQAFPNLMNWQLKNEIEKYASQYQHPDSLLGYGLPDFMRMYMMANPADEYTYGQSFLMSVHNNPFTDQIGIELYSSKTQNVKFELLDAQGKVACSETKEVLQNQYLIFGLEDLHYISSGFYFLRVYGDNGEWITRKVVKE